MYTVIIGNGIAGITAALTIRKLSPNPVTIISGEHPHFYARTALMYLYLGQLRFENIKGYEDWFWAEKQLTLKHAWVNAIDFTHQTLQLDSGETLDYDNLILATGSKTNFGNWPGQELTGVCGFYHLQDLAAIEQHTAGCQKAVIAGGGLIGVELAEMLHSRGIKITLLVRDGHYWGKKIPAEEAHLIQTTFRKRGITLRFNTTIGHIQGDPQNRVQAVIASTGEKIPCTFVGIATGVIPNLELARRAGLPTNRGILVNQFLETSQPHVYAIGDCAELTFAGNRVEQLWYTGRLQGETVAHTICGRKTSYDRGIPFNSAKFFDLEFQSYGLVVPPTEPETASVYWQHPEKPISLRLNYVKGNGNPVCGVVSMGLRLRQEICESWIERQTPLATVISHLGDAFFDPEFSPSHQNAMQKAFKTQLPEMEIKTVAKRKFFWF